MVLVNDEADAPEMTLKAFTECHLVSQVDRGRDGEKLTDCLLRWDTYVSKRDAPLREIKTHLDLRRIPIVKLTTSKAGEEILRIHDLRVSSRVTRRVAVRSPVKPVKFL